MLNEEVVDIERERKCGLDPTVTEMRVPCAPYRRSGDQYCQQTHDPNDKSLDAHMIPYLAQPRFEIMGLTFYAFGVFAATALLLGWWAIMRRAQKVGLGRGKVARLTFHMLWWGFWGSHMLYLALFRTEDLTRRPWRLLNPLDGIYSFGGILSGIAVSVWLARRYNFTRRQLWLYLDAVGFVFPFCWTIARAGCALAHDHVGVASTSWIAVRFPEGPHLDLGLIEAISSAGLALCFLLLDRLTWPAPFFFGLSLFGNGLFRLWLDTLHNSPATSDRSFGWGSTALGCVMLIASWQHRVRRYPA